MEKQVFKTLPCSLTDEELIKKVNEVSALQFSFEEEDALKKTHGIKAKKLKADIDIIINQISTKTEYREVECTWEYNWDSGYKTLVRIDTGEIMNNLPIEDFERQQSMPL